MIWLVGRDRSSTDRSLDLVVLWLASIAALVIAVAGAPRRHHLTRLRAWFAGARTEVLLVVGVGVIALIPRVYQLNSYPLTMSGDEGIFANSARSVLRGDIRNPFITGFWGYPTLIFVVQSWILRVTGETVAGARLLSALLGVASVVAIYCLTRHHLGRWTALIAAVLAAAFHFHLFYSRDAQVPVAPMLFIPLALLFLDRGLVGRRRIDSLVAGLVIAIAQFTHPGCVILYPLAALYILYAFVFRRPTNRSALRKSFAEVAPNAILVVVGAVVGQLPLLAYYYGHPDQYGVRSSQVSVFSSGWLEREQEITGKGAVEILWIQFQNAALLPFETLPHGFYRPDVPFVGWPLAVPVAIGLTIATLAFWKRSYFGLVAAFWAGVAGLAITEGPPQTNRYVASVPFLLIFAAIGIVAVVRIAIGLMRLPRYGVVALATAVTLLIAGWHLHYYFRDERQVEVYSDVNSEIASDLAREADSHGNGLTVYFSGAPRLTMGGFNSVAYIADKANRVDVMEPWQATDAPPHLVGSTLFAFVPERLDELDVVRSWFPNGTVQEHLLPSGELMYTSYFINGTSSDATRG
jgi:4-amino-4-deoxy-L-arabinose transferase-like glycosyltransferase